MPLYPFHCDECDIERSLFISFSSYDSVKETLACETCGARLRRIYTPIPIHDKEINTQDMDPGEKELHHRQRKYLESRAKEIKSGELEIKLKGPKEFWPRNLD
jgi:putative FmdB family regulatory protein